MTMLKTAARETIFRLSGMESGFLSRVKDNISRVEGQVEGQII